MFRPIVIINICIALALIGGGFFFWWPSFQDFTALNQEVERKKIEVQQKEEYYEKLAETFNQLVQYDEQIKKIDVAFPKEPSIAALLNYLEKTSLENGLVIGNISIGSTGGMGSAKGSGSVASSGKITIPFTVSGPYSALKNFLDALYKNSRLIEVDSVRFSSSEDQKDIFDASLTISTNSFAKSEENMPAAPAQRI